MQGLYVALCLGSMFIGVTFVVIATLVSRNKEKAEQENMNAETSAINMQLVKSIEEADGTMEQLTKMSSLVLDELENKYKELLFLYQLVDDKKMEVDKLHQQIESTALLIDSQSKAVEMNMMAYSLPSHNALQLESSVQPVNKMELDNSVEVENEAPSTQVPERFASVIEMYQNGKEIAEIAKELNIGQGEIKLILGLGKMR